jgi:hypothetical protein
MTTSMTKDAKILQYLKWNFGQGEHKNSLFLFALLILNTEYFYLN